MALKLSREKQIKQGLAYKRSGKQEGQLAKKLGGRVTKGSGSQREKGDVRKTGLCRIECKSTQRLSFPVTRDTLFKIQSAAASTSEIPALIVEFLNERGAVENEIAIIPVFELLALIKKASANQDGP